MKWRFKVVAALMWGTTIGPLLAEGSSHADAFTDEGLFKSDVSALKDTQLVPHPDAPLGENKNVIWCATLQLAWNEAIGLVGEKLHFVNQPPVVSELNKEDFDRADLDAGSYVAIADFERNNVEDEIRAALKETFHGAASPELIPEKPSHPGPDDFTAYAYLFKNLAFEQAFLDQTPLDFGTARVKGFGFPSKESDQRDKLIAQVSICWYNSDDNFIIKLKTKATGDELILAKIPPSPTLQGTMDYVLRQIAAHNPPDTPGEGDYLAVPKLNFDLRGDFPTLENLVLDPGPTAKVKNLVTASVKQLVRFQLNEKGAVLKSEAAIQMATSAMRQGPPPRQLVFNKPFLILMKRADSSKPYFAMWVGNASLLVPAK